MQLTNQHRENLDNLTTLAIADVVGAMTILKDEPLATFAYQAGQILPPVVETYTTVAADLAVDYYDSSRALATLETTYTAVPILPDVNPIVQSSIAYATGIATRGSTWEDITAVIAGAVQRAVNGGDRGTISFNVEADPSGDRWQRVPSIRACTFCKTMAAVAEVQDDQNFTKYHNYCRCTSLPIFSGQDYFRQPWYGEVESAYSSARDTLSERQSIAREKFYAELPQELRGTKKAATMFYRKNPDLSLTTKNILKEVRQQTGWK